LGIRVITVIDRIDLCVFVALASIGILYNAIVRFRVISVEGRRRPEAVAGVGRSVLAVCIVVIVISLGVLVVLI